jgi:hypothetical protein
LTDPLIDPREMAVTILHALPQNSTTNLMAAEDCDAAVDAVLHYLRSVLTPEALKIFVGTDLHRRIFGEV